jgi:hypothetical protein
MNRIFSLIALAAAGFSAPAFAADTAVAPATDANPVLVEAAALSASANAEQARKVLQAQGYTNVSDLSRDASGRWAGTASKDGKTIFIAIALPAKTPATPAAN